MTTRTWFTSDPHFGHTNVIKYCNRPFKSVEEMDAALIDNWNSTVADGDQVYILGDFSFYKTEKTAHILSKLKGFKSLIIGNHDQMHLHAYALKVNMAVHYHEITLQKQFIVLCHFPMLSWNKSQHGSWMLHGHTHGRLDKTTAKRYDCGVDCNDYKPVSFEALQKIMAKRESKKIAQ